MVPASASRHTCRNGIQVAVHSQLRIDVAPVRLLVARPIAPRRPTLRCARPSSQGRLRDSIRTSFPPAKEQRRSRMRADKERPTLPTHSCAGSVPFTISRSVPNGPSCRSPVPRRPESRTLTDCRPTVQFGPFCILRHEQQPLAKMPQRVRTENATLGQ